MVVSTCMHTGIHVYSYTCELICLLLGVISDSYCHQAYQNQLFMSIPISVVERWFPSTFPNGESVEDNANRCRITLVYDAVGGLLIEETSRREMPCV